jgi:hypothetical protein
MRRSGRPENCKIKDRAGRTIGDATTPKTRTMATSSVTNRWNGVGLGSRNNRASKKTLRKRKKCPISLGQERKHHANDKKQKPAFPHSPTKASAIP